MRSSLGQVALRHAGVAEPRPLSGPWLCKRLERVPINGRYRLAAVASRWGLGRETTSLGAADLGSTWRSFKRHDRQALPTPALHSLRRGLLFVQSSALLTAEMRMLGYQVSRDFCP